MLRAIRRAAPALPASASHVRRIGPGDDAAVANLEQVVTVDALVEGVHFDGRLSPEDVGFKAIAASVSDICAMGASPRWATLALSLPDERSGWVDAFAAGLALACATFGVDLLGGDTTGSPGPAIVSVTMGGHLHGPPWLRSGARPGDELWVTGTLGLAGAGWRMATPPPDALAALRRPSPPVAFARAAARRRLVSAAMDLSDGLAADLPRLCAASGCDARVDLAAIPTADQLDDALDHALRGGEDYQLLLAARPRHGEALRAAAHAAGVRLTRIGDLVTRPDAQPSTIRDLDARPLRWPTPAFQHLAAEAAPC